MKKLDMSQLIEQIDRKIQQKQKKDKKPCIQCELEKRFQLRAYFQETELQNETQMPFGGLQNSSNVIASRFGRSLKKSKLTETKYKHLYEQIQPNINERRQNDKLNFSLKSSNHLLTTQDLSFDINQSLIPKVETSNNTKRQSKLQSLINSLQLSIRKDQGCNQYTPIQNLTQCETEINNSFQYTQMFQTVPESSSFVQYETNCSSENFNFGQQAFSNQNLYKKNQEAFTIRSQQCFDSSDKKNQSQSSNGSNFQVQIDNFKKQLNDIKEKTYQEHQAKQIWLNQRIQTYEQEKKGKQNKLSFEEKLLQKQTSKHVNLNSSPNMDFVQPQQDCQFYFEETSNKKVQLTQVLQQEGIEKVEEKRKALTFNECSEFYENDSISSQEMEEDQFKFSFAPEEKQQSDKNSLQTFQCKSNKDLFQRQAQTQNSHFYLSKNDGQKEGKPRYHKEHLMKLMVKMIQKWVYVRTLRVIKQYIKLKKREDENDSINISSPHYKQNSTCLKNETFQEQISQEQMIQYTEVIEKELQTFCDEQYETQEAAEQKEDLKVQNQREMVEGERKIQLKNIYEQDLSKLIQALERIFSTRQVHIFKEINSIAKNTLKVILQSKYK